MSETPFGPYPNQSDFVGNTAATDPDSIAPEMLRGVFPPYRPGAQSGMQPTVSNGSARRADCPFFFRRRTLPRTLDESKASGSFITYPTHLFV
jgi:hypothetical protein